MGIGGLAPLFGANGLEEAINATARLFPAGSFFSFGFNICALCALLLVSLTCGAVGSLVVGGRMAFFSDALAHCAFAGISLGFLVFDVFLAGHRPPREFWDWATPVMVAFGALVGAGIAFARLRTGLSSDTVIGVFFAGAIGLAALLRKVIQNRPELFKLEDFLFGDPLLVRPHDLVLLAGLALLTAVTLALIYNHLLLASFNSSLALSRRVPVRLCNYLFIILLAVIVNLCLRCVGALLINALLVVPAATAANLGRNMRQLFWLTIALCVGTSLAGHWLSWEVEAGTGFRVRLGISGTVILLSVLLFTLSVAAEPLLRRRRLSPAAEPSPAQPA
jgi:zinc transport system permease protein